MKAAPLAVVEPFEQGTDGAAARPVAAVAMAVAAAPGKVGLQRYSEAGMVAKLAVSGFTASRAHFNIGHNPWRMTFVARHAF